jgi:hypothetical protein
MGRLDDYSEEEQATILGFTGRDTICDITPEEANECLIYYRLSELGIQASEAGYEDLSSALANLEFLFIVGYGKPIAERLETVANEVRVSMLRDKIHPVIGQV